MVTLKIARTADGFAAGDEHDPGSLSPARSPTAGCRRCGDARGYHGGVGTALGDDPLLTVRHNGLDQRPCASCSTARCGCRWIAAGRNGRLVSDVGHRRRQLRRASARRPCWRAALRSSGRGEGPIDLGGALRLLGQRGITRVLERRRADGRLGADPRRGSPTRLFLITAEKPLGGRGGRRWSPTRWRRWRKPRVFARAGALYGTDTLRSWSRV